MGCSSLKTEQGVKPLFSAELAPPSGACLDTHQCCCQKMWIRQSQYPRAAQNWFFPQSSEAKEWLFHTAILDKPQCFPDPLSKPFQILQELKCSETVSLTHHWAYRPSVLLLQSRAPSSVLFLRFSVSELGTKRLEINRLVGTIRTGNKSEEGDTGTLQEMPCPCIQVDEREIQNSVGTLISLFTFLLLRFNVLLWCCFDFLDPGSPAKSNPNSQGHPTGSKIISDSAPLSFPIPPSLSFRGIKSVHGLRWWSYFNLILCHISNQPK